jgi:hypothetical protein
LLGEVKAKLDVMAVPVGGAVSDGQHSIRNAIASALPGVPHQLCQFHFLREAALPVYERDGPPRQEGTEEESPRRPRHRAPGRRA